MYNLLRTKCLHVCLHIDWNLYCTFKPCTLTSDKVNYTTALPALFLSMRDIPVLLPLDVDSINENDSVANPDPTPRIASVHKSRFAEVVLVGCWMEAVYYCLLLRKR